MSNVDRAAEEWISHHGRYGDYRINRAMNEAFTAGFAFAGSEVTRLQQEIRDMERDFRAEMQTLQAEKRQAELTLAQREAEQERTNWL